MTDEELAEEIANKRCHEIMCYGHCSFNSPKHHRCGEWHREYNCALEGLKAGRPQWHKVADGDLPKGEEYGKNNIHRKIYLKDRHGNLYTGNYFPKDDNHKEDCFAVEFLDWGFQGSQFCAKEQISEWCEIPTFDKE